MSQLRCIRYHFIVVLGTCYYYLACAYFRCNVFQQLCILFVAVLKGSDNEISLYKKVSRTVIVAAELLARHRVDTNVSQSVCFGNSLHSVGKLTLYAAHVGYKGVFAYFRSIIIEKYLRSLREKSDYNKVVALKASVENVVKCNIAESGVLDIVIKVAACYCMICIFFQRFAK